MAQQAEQVKINPDAMRQIVKILVAAKLRSLRQADASNKPS